MKLLVNDLKLYFGLMFLLPLTLTGHKLHCILFTERLIDYLHCASSSLCFFQSR